MCAGTWLGLALSAPAGLAWPAPSLILPLGGLIFAAGFGIFNVFSMSVIDRQRDLAILQAIGVDRKLLMQSFLIQGAAVGLIGSLAGLLLGQILIEWLASLSFGTADEQRPVSGSGAWR